MKPLLFLLLARTIPPAYADQLIGDLEEESHGKPAHWLIRHTLTAATTGLQMRLAHANALETAAATAFLLGLPLILTLELRRYALTLIPFREAADFSTPALIALTLAIALLTAWETTLLGRRWLPVLMATTITAIIAALTNSPMLLTAAALAGGALATRPKERNPA